LLCTIFLLFSSKKKRIALFVYQSKYSEKISSQIMLE
jgi:hypothetical protein